MCTGQFNEATDDASYALQFLKETYADDLDGYDGDSVQYIVAVLRERYPDNALSARYSNNAYQSRQNASSRTHGNNNNNNNNNNNTRLTLASSSSFAATDAEASRHHSVTTATPDVAKGDGVRGVFDAAHDVVDEYANVGWMTDVFSGAIPINSSGTETKSNNRSSSRVPPPSYFENDSYAERLLEIAHIFHFVSIAILGIFVIQV